MQADDCVAKSDTLENGVACVTVCLYVFNLTVPLQSAMWKAGQNGCLSEYKLISHVHPHSDDVSHALFTSVTCYSMTFLIGSFHCFTLV